LVLEVIDVRHLVSGWGSVGLLATGGGTWRYQVTEKTRGGVQRGGDFCPSDFDCLFDNCGCITLGIFGTNGLQPLVLY